MKKGMCLTGALIMVVALLALVMGRLNHMLEPAMNRVTAQQPALVLDAGHGGEDGGAVSLTGVPESQINLAIVLDMRDILGLYGVEPLLLREEDISLHDSSAATLRAKKRSDLKNRVAAVEELENAILVSIHQNTYTSSRYHGTQIFYAPTEGSRALAEYVREKVQERLQPDNQRAVKQIPDSVYLMNHITCPAILIECGFLTNPEEEAKLRDEDYQKQLAVVIAGACLTAPEAGE